MTTRLTLGKSDGALRVRLGEEDWAACVAVTDVAFEGALRPAVAPPEEAPAVEAALRQAVAVAVSSPARVEVSTAARGRGLAGSLGSDGRSCAGAVRAIAPPGVVDPEAVAVPGVEVSAFGPARLADELLRLFPPELPDAPATPPEPLTLPRVPALVLSRALEQDDQDLVREIVATLDLAQVPELVAELAREVVGNATLVFHQPASAHHGGGARVRRWLQCRLGWVELLVSDDRIEHRPCTREEIRAVVVAELATSLEKLLVVAEAG